MVGFRSLQIFAGVFMSSVLYMNSMCGAYWVSGLFLWIPLVGTLVPLWSSSFAPSSTPGIFSSSSINNYLKRLSNWLFFILAAVCLLFIGFFTKINSFFYCLCCFFQIPSLFHCTIFLFIPNMFLFSVTSLYLARSSSDTFESISSWALLSSFLVVCICRHNSYCFYRVLFVLERFLLFCYFISFCMLFCWFLSAVSLQFLI